ncbi:MAG: hypothetical protein IPN59_00550 [Holophaga sp.]|nr:hypothetical protein [Holophaga sp.]
MLTIAEASGNIFGYLWADSVPADFDGSRWAKVLCPRGAGFGLDGLFLLYRPQAAEPWRMEHWEPDGSHTFCSNGTRAAACLIGHAPGELEALVSGENVRLRMDDAGVGLRLAEGAAYGLQPSPLRLDHPHALGWTGTPHLIVEVVDVDAVDLATFAPPLRFHPALDQGANVSIIHVLEPGRARIRSWERGVEGETLCCGQGCAVAGAWLAQRSGLDHWQFQPVGRHSVDVSVGSIPDGKWSELWISGPVHRLGTLVPDPALLAQI